MFLLARKFARAQVRESVREPCQWPLPELAEPRRKPARKNGRRKLRTISVYVSSICTNNLSTTGIPTGNCDVGKLRPLKLARHNDACHRGSGEHEVLGLKDCFALVGLAPANVQQHGYTHADSNASPRASGWNAHPASEAPAETVNSLNSAPRELPSVPSCGDPRWQQRHLLGELPKVGSLGISSSPTDIYGNSCSVAVNCSNHCDGRDATNVGHFADFLNIVVDPRAKPCSTQLSRKRAATTYDCHAVHGQASSRGSMPAHPVSFCASAGDGLKGSMPAHPVSFFASASSDQHGRCEAFVVPSSVPFCGDPRRKQRHLIGEPKAGSLENNCSHSS